MEEDKKEGIGEKVQTALKLVTILVAIAFVLFWRWTFRDPGVKAEATGINVPTGKGVTVAVIDSGLNVGFVGAPKNIAEGRYYFFCEEKNGPYMLDGYGTRQYGYYSNDNVEDESGHGTTVATIVAHYAPDVTIMPLKQSTSKPGYVGGTASSVVSCLNYAVDNGADIINMSFHLLKGHSPAVEEAIKRASNAGCILIAAAGNDGSSSPKYPAAYPGVISVGAVDDQGKIEDWSNYGEFVDIYAKGAEIRVVGEPSMKYTGTSFSAPMVSAMAALALETDPDMTQEEFLDLLKASCDPVVGNYSTGALNVERFLSTKKEERPCLTK